MRLHFISPFLIASIRVQNIVIVDQVLILHVFVELVNDGRVGDRVYRSCPRHFEVSNERRLEFREGYRYISMKLVSRVDETCR